MVTSESGFIYVIRDGRRVWKSPKAKYYLAMTDDEPDRVDLDGDGAVDFVWYGFKAHLAHEFGFFVSLHDGVENYLLHFDPWGKTSVVNPLGDPLVSASSRIRPVVAARLAAYLDKRLASSQYRPAFADQLRSGTYASMRDPKDAYPELVPLHATAVALHRAKKEGEASDALDGFFAAYDFRQVDPEKLRPEYTGILNDYAFFLTEAGHAADALPALAYVIERDPKRAVAYLNMADALCSYSRVEERRAEFRSLAPGYYREYAELMSKGGKEKQVPKRVRDRIAAGACPK